LEKLKNTRPRNARVGRIEELRGKMGNRTKGKKNQEGARRISNGKKQTPQKKMREEKGNPVSYNAII